MCSFPPNVSQVERVSGIEVDDSIAACQCSNTGLVDRILKSNESHRKGGFADGGALKEFIAQTFKLSIRRMGKGG
jgi:hypothetical protein